MKDRPTRGPSGPDQNVPQRPTGVPEQPGQTTSSSTARPTERRRTPQTEVSGLPSTGQEAVPLPSVKRGRRGERPVSSVANADVPVSQSPWSFGDDGEPVAVSVDDKTYEPKHGRRDHGTPPPAESARAEQHSVPDTDLASQVPPTQPEDVHRDEQPVEVFPTPGQQIDQQTQQVAAMPPIPQREEPSQQEAENRTSESDGSMIDTTPLPQQRPTRDEQRAEVLFSEIDAFLDKIPPPATPPTSNTQPSQQVTDHPVDGPTDKPADQPIDPTTPAKPEGRRRFEGVLNEMEARMDENTFVVRVDDLHEMEKFAQSGKTPEEYAEREVRKLQRWRFSPREGYRHAARTSIGGVRDHEARERYKAVLRDQASKFLGLGPDDYIKLTEQHDPVTQASADPNDHFRANDHALNSIWNFACRWGVAKELITERTAPHDSRLTAITLPKRLLSQYYEYLREEG